MKIVVAVDSFKGSLTSLQAGNAVREGALLADPTAEVTVCPVADGGEGTVDALCAALKGVQVQTEVTGPLGEIVTAQYAIINDDTAVIEMAAAAGITLMPENCRNPMKTTTYGVGEIIRDGISRGCRRFIVGIGGSATNDGGVGMLSALGFSFLDSQGKEIPRGAAGLEKLASISTENALPELKECAFRIACDVKNPLCGEMGCSAVYGPQKGADRDMIEKMDAWLANYGRLAAEVSDRADMTYPGVGAAGGLGFAFLSFLNATLESGIHIVEQEIALEDQIRRADLVITGEGRLDGQSIMGKVPVGVAKIARKYGIPVIAFAGCVTEEASACNDWGIDAFFPIIPGAMTLEEAMDPENAYRNLRNTAYQVFRLLHIYIKR